MATYIALKKIDVLRENKEGKKDFLGNIAMDVVQTIQLGQEFEASENTFQAYNSMFGNYTKTNLILTNGGHVELNDAVLKSGYGSYMSKKIIEQEARRKLDFEIAKLPIGAERDKLIAQQNALQAELNRASEKNLKLYIGLGIVAVLAVGYFAYKKLKK